MDYFELLSKNKIAELDKYLITHDLNEEIHGQSLLYWAVHHNNLQFVQHLVYQGVDINKKDSLGRTGILIGCYYGFYDVVKFLLENGANFDGCLERAEHGWDGHSQTEIIELLNIWKKNKHWRQIP
jgi:ankyrin repeat protein